MRFPLQADENADSACDPSTDCQSNGAGLESTVDGLASTQSNGVRRWLDRGLVVLVLLCCGVALSKNYADPDLWGHVSYGRDLLRDGLPSTTTYSFTAAGHRWINHENLSEVALAVGMDVFGPRGLLLLKFGLGLTILGCMLRYMRRCDVRRPLDFVFVLLVAANLMHFWSMRPQVFSYFLFAMQVLLLNYCFASAGRDQRTWKSEPTRRRLLWLFPPLFVIWANTHGAFVAGFAILTVYLMGRAVEALWREGRTALPLACQLAGVVAATGLATLLNPYGWELHHWLLQSLGMPRPEIIEWRPPELFSIVWIPLWVMVAATVLGVVGTRRPRDVTQLVLLALTLWQALDHRRHIPFFAILFGFWAVPHVASAIGRLRWASSEAASADRPSQGMQWTIGLLACFAGLMVSTNLVKQLWTIPVKRNDYPVSAFEYIAQQRLEGNLVVRFKWAQYAIAAFAAGRERPAVRVAFDGRFRTCYPQEVVDMYFDFALGNHPTEPRHRSPDSPPIDGRRLLRETQADLALVDRQQVHSVYVMSSLHEHWVLLYQDELSQLWGRRERYADPQSVHYVPEGQRRISDSPQEGFARWPALPETNDAFQLTRSKPDRSGRES